MQEFIETGGGAEEKKLLVTVTNPFGFHARPAAKFVECAAKYRNCEVFVEKDGARVNGKSIMGLMLFAAEQGSEMMLIARGENAEQCLKDLCELFKRNFGEDEIGPKELTNEGKAETF
jgi:phosphocarrier protein